MSFLLNCSWICDLGSGQSLLDALVREIDISPAREAVLLVPGALAVANQHNLVRGHLSCARLQNRFVLRALLLLLPEPKAHTSQLTPNMLQPSPQPNLQPTTPP